MSPALVSICIPTFNGEKFLQAAMQSAIDQTYRPLEIIISDDASEDGTLDIVNAFISKTEIPIKIFKHDPNGIGANWNHCVNKAEGQYIKFLFQDDLLTKECIQEMMQVAVQDQQIGLVFSKRDFAFDGDIAKYQTWVGKHLDLQSAWTEISSIQQGRVLLKDEKLLCQPRNKVGEPTAVLLNKQVFEKVGYFNTRLKQSLDYEFWYRVFKYYKVAYIDRELATFRLHDLQTTNQNRKLVISDGLEYPRLMYKNLFWCLHPKVQKELFFKFNLIGKLIKKLSK